MNRRRGPASLVAERAVRHLRQHGRSMGSRELAIQVLATHTTDEVAAQQVLEAAFGGDPRLFYDERGWGLVAEARPAGQRRREESDPADEALDASTEPDRALVVLAGEPPAPGKPYRLLRVSAIRLRGDEVLAACGGDTVDGRGSRRLRRAVRETLENALLIVHDPPGALTALERWLQEPLDPLISLRALGRQRLGLPARHGLETLVARLGLGWRETDDPLELADTLDACLESLREPGESLDDLLDDLNSGAPAIDWSRFDFDREMIDRIPQAPGTYRFFDTAGELLYIGKSKNLHQRIQSYFREGNCRPARVQRLLDELQNLTYETTGSSLEAALREAELIRSEKPRANVQRDVHVRSAAGRRPRSMLILEPAAPPSVLRAYLICRGRLIDRIAIGPRGGGLKRVARMLDDHFFSVPDGPSDAVGPDLDVEMIVRWLAENRDRVVAFDPTDLRSAQEVIDRLRWFLGQGSLFDPDGTPVLSQ